MFIDLAPVRNGEMKYIDLAATLTVDDLRAATNASIDFLLSQIIDLTDADVTFDPVDPEANDPHAAPGEEHIGWSLAHLIAHFTASSEEWAAYASILARGIVYTPEPRLRYETPWRDITTQAQAVQRLEESRRIRLGYLSTFPDTPFLDVKRELSERFIERHGELNAVAGFLFGLSHEYGHYEQVKEVRRQVIAARSAATQTATATVATVKTVGTVETASAATGD
ncbi:MAG TPA: DinB family protein [Phototrophicaceae bacterium]|nr:DinB family protein [Phototrophicaceae bacterium]